MKLQKVGTRLAGLVVLFAALLVGLSALGLYQQAHTLDDLEEIYQERLKPLNAIGNMAGNLRGDVVEILSAFQHDPNNPISKLHDHPITLHLQNLEKNQKEELEDWQKYTSTHMDEEEKKVAAEFEALFRRYKSEVIEPAAKAIEKGDFSNARLADFQRARIEVGNKLSALARQLGGTQEVLSQKSHDVAVSDYERGRILVLSLTALGIFLAILGAFLIIRSITKPLTQMRNALVYTQETGDFTKDLQIKRQDEIGQTAQAFNDLQHSVRKAFGQLNQSIYEVSQSASDMANNSGESAKAAADTSASTATMATAVEEMTVSINHVGDSSKNALSIAKEAGALSMRGNEVIHKAVSEINKIAETVKNVSADINQLGERSDNISSVIQVIREVADQTNLLALNAAIEAARAGETGRGFAVVADEVRKLAERTATATSEISQMITEIQESAKGAVRSMASAVTQVDAGVTLAKDAGEAITQIYESTENVVKLVDGISDAIVEQASASDSISTQVERVAQAAEETSTTSQAASESAHHLETLSTRMKQAAAEFKVETEG